VNMEGYWRMGRGEIVDCRATSTEIVSRRQWTIGPAASTYGKTLTESQADLTRCPSSLNHNKVALGYEGREPLRSCWVGLFEQVPCL